MTLSKRAFGRLTCQWQQTVCRGTVNFWRRSNLGNRCWASHVRPPREILGVSQNCTEADVKATFRREAKRLHPDLHRGSDKETAAENFRELQTAYRALLRELQDPNSRSRFQSQHGPASNGKPSWAGGAQEWENARKRAESMSSNVPGMTRRFRSLLWYAAGACCFVLLWRIYDEHLDRQQEEADMLEFAAKRARLRQENAERQQRELLETRSSVDELIERAEKQAAEAAVRRDRQSRA
eukprot:TRINITY_DN94111_c0_g1_i1.p1 TRINITY_DN94111_c0_g1~~TRINITY_DN94111_c0_g1_i1.p1  ORF type:complete len:239 (+),score=41.88 TRINITY_DN94111_c0_g1_i1:133-849(+)